MVHPTSVTNTVDRLERRVWSAGCPTPGTAAACSPRSPTRARRRRAGHRRPHGGRLRPGDVRRGGAGADLRPVPRPARGRRRLRRTETGFPAAALTRLPHRHKPGQKLLGRPSILEGTSRVGSVSRTGSWRWTPSRSRRGARAGRRGSTGARKRDADFTTLSGVEVEPVYGPDGPTTPASSGSAGRGSSRSPGACTHRLPRAALDDPAVRRLRQRRSRPTSATR